MSEELYYCPRCKRRAARDGWGRNPRQGTMRCPVCEREGALDILPERIPDELLRPLTAEEAQKAYDEAPEVPLSEERIQQIVDAATAEGKTDADV